MIKEHRGIPYIVHVGPIGSHCAYIRIPDSHPWNHLVDKITKFTIPGCPEREIHNGYDDIPLDVHGGLTFCCRKLEGEKEWPQGFTPGAWIGWDYFHLGDFSPSLELLRFCDKEHYWIYSEVEQDCINAIDQMLGD